jgi:hypothetical protein
MRSSFSLVFSFLIHSLCRSFTQFRLWKKDSPFRQTSTYTLCLFIFHPDTDYQHKMKFVGSCLQWKPRFESPARHFKRLDNIMLNNSKRVTLRSTDHGDEYWRNCCSFAWRIEQYLTNRRLVVMFADIRMTQKSYNKLRNVCSHWNTRPRKSKHFSITKESKFCQKVSKKQ